MLAPFFLSDLAESLRAWRKWYLLGIQAVRIRYTRSRLGQFWISLSFLITVLSLSFVYAYLWKVELSDFMPYFATGFLFWSFINSTITEGCTAFAAADGFIKAERQPMGMFPLVVLFRNLTVFAHNVIVLAPLFLIMGKTLSAEAFLLVPGFLLLLLNLYWITLFIGMVSARFRDIPSVVAALMQLAFFATPVLWQPEAISDPSVRFALSELNPFGALIAVVRDPLLGVVPTVVQYANVSILALVGWAATALLFQRYGKRIVYWL